MVTNGVAFLFAIDAMLCYDFMEDSLGHEG
jgi:hypothetical protein